MTGCRSGSGVVASVGWTLPVDPEGRFRLERIDRAFAADYAAYADCLVLREPGGGLAALETLRGCDVPTVLYDRGADPATAQAATRLGVTEYVPGGAVADLYDRIATVVDTGADRDRHASALEALTEAKEALRSAGTVEEIADIAAETAAHATGSDAVAVRLLDDEGVIATAALGTAEPPDAEVAGAPDEAAVESALRRDEVVVGDGSGLSPPTATVPVGDRAVLSVGCGAGPVEDVDRRLLSALGTDIEAALCRLDRRRELRRREALNGAAEHPAFVLGADDRIELATRAFADRVGSDPDRLVGRPVAELFGDGFRTRYESATAGTNGDDPTTVETVLRPADGEAVPVSVALSPLPSETGPGAILGVLNGRSDGEGALDPDREPRFRYLFDQLPDAVVDVEFVDGVPFVRDVNEAFEETFGYEESDVLDTPLNDLIVPDGHDSEAEAIDEMAIRRGHDAAEVERATADGCRTFLFRGFTYSGGERERGFGIYTDITDRLEQERRLRVLHRVLRHNLRNEMTAIAGYADLLLETASSSEAVEYASRIHEEATDVSKLGEQVRRIEQALDIDRTRVALDPDPLVREIADRFRSSCPEATIRITSNGDGRVIADELLKIAIENLVENAIEHHPDAATVEIELSPIEGGWFDIAIRDDGPGIPERERAVVGGDREITQLDHSMGLGLWVSRWVVRGVDGQLLFGDADTGAEVTIRLRRADEYPELE